MCELTDLKEGSEEGEMFPVPTPMAGASRKWVTPEPKRRRGPKHRWGKKLMYEVAVKEQRLVALGAN